MAPTAAPPLPGTVVGLTTDWGRISYRFVEGAVTDDFVSLSAGDRIPAKGDRAAESLGRLDGDRAGRQAEREPFERVGPLREPAGSLSDYLVRVRLAAGKIEVQERGVV